MKLLAAVFLLGIMSAFASQEDDAIIGLAGVYSREDGLKQERLTLAQDRTYTFATKGDIGSDEEKGVWRVHEGHVLLEPRKRGAIFKNKSSKFLILALHADPLLRIVDEISSEAAEDDPRFFFWRQHEKKG